MEKKFDCLKMKEEIQAKIYQETKDMTFPELDAYFNKSVENNALWKKIPFAQSFKQFNRVTI